MLNNNYMNFNHHYLIKINQHHKYNMNHRYFINNMNWKEWKNN